MLRHLLEGGIDQLERFLDDPKATEMLYDKFDDYRTFAEGYGCPLVADGGVAVTRQVDDCTGACPPLRGVEFSFVVYGIR